MPRLSLRRHPLPLDAVNLSDYPGVPAPGAAAPVGGRLALFILEWEKITQDPFILSVIRLGFQISVSRDFPGVLREATATPRDPNVIHCIRSEIDSLLFKGAIVQVDDFPLLCLSPIFVIPKKTGDLRVILNLKKINLFIPVQHFRMETLSLILPQLSSQDWAVSLDLKDAYLHVLVHPQSRKFLGFAFQGVTYQYKVLPFGLKDSPWVFSRVVATLIAHLRRLGLRIFYYLDDWLLVAESKELLESHLRIMVSITQSVGFLVNFQKSSLSPQRLPSYLGALIDIPNQLARPLDHRVVALQSLVQDLTSSQSAPALLWQRFLGHLASFVDLIPNCRLLMRPLQLHLLRFFSPVMDPQDKLIPLTPVIKDLCLAWASPERLLQGKSFAPPPSPRLVLTTDASRQGWGAVLPPHRVSGIWSKEDASLHINSLELKAVFLALQELEPHVKGRSIQVRSDNSTVVAYINHQGGTHSFSLCQLALDLWFWCLHREISLLSVHLPGEHNLVADFLSRGRFLPSEWTLNPSVFRRICLTLSPPPEIDLFASTLNFQLPRYCSRFPDPQAWRIDALSFPWSGLRLYAFPPFALLPTILEKIVQDEADVGLVAPFWPQRPWFPRLLRLLVDLPRSLPCQENLIAQPLSHTTHPRWESLHLSLWPLSGNKGKRLAFLRELPSSQLSLSDCPLGRLTIPDWSSSGAGVPRSIVIPFLPL